MRAAPAVAAGAIAAAVLGLGAPALAETYEVSPDGTHDVSVGTDGSSADGTVAISTTGSAQGRCVYGGSLLGCLTGPGIAASGTGSATGGVAASGTGNAYASGLGWGTPVVAVSGTGCAVARDPYGLDPEVPVSGTGCTGT